MKDTKSSSKQLIAPCGMNCAICSKYLSYVNNLKRSQCVGCRPRNKRCEYLFAKCSGANNDTTGNAVFCFECDQYPCKEIQRMDNRYRKSYNMSVKDNLDYIKENGVENFINQQYRKHYCLKCGELISIHNRKCFKCETVTRLVEKHNCKH